MTSGKLQKLISSTITHAEAGLSFSNSRIPIVLQHYIESQLPSRGQAIHSYLIKTGRQAGINTSIKLMILYLKCDCLKYARQTFVEIPYQTISAYSYMASGYFKHGLNEELLSLVRGIKFTDERPYSVILSMLLKLSVDRNSSQVVKGVHNQIFKLTCEFDEVLFTPLIDSYAKTGNLDYARRVFNNLSVKNFICSTALITGYMNKGLFGEAEEIFKNVLDKDIVLFNAMIEGYSKKIENAKKACELYKDIQNCCLLPTVSTFVSIIGACSILSAMEFGQQIHCQLMKTGLLSDLQLGSALIDMYCKCGQPKDARRLFDSLLEKNVVTWTSMIDGYGKNGNSDEALRLFTMMLKDSSVRPNYVTFLIALSACGHSGLLSVGKKIFESMERDYLIKPMMEHYACMVDIMGRLGCLSEAYEFIRRIPDRPSSDVWAALLGACRLHGDVELAAIAANEVFNSSCVSRPGAYVALSNSFAAAEKWEGVSKVRKLMKEKGVGKQTAWSWIDTD